MDDSDSIYPDWILQAEEYSLECISKNLSELESFPELTSNGQWETVSNGGWVGGHWVGLLWLTYATTKEPSLEQAAREWSARLAPRQFDETTHDLGFLFKLSHVLGYQVTGDETFIAPALQAADTLCKRFNQKGCFFQAWRALDASPEYRGRAIVDTMMNLDLLFWASQQSGNRRYGELANQHAHTVIKYHIRKDYSTSHVIDFNPDTGEFLKQDTHQGMSGSSCWSRGQSWAVYGFADCYRATKEKIFLETARKLAHYALDKLPSDQVPFWDYDSPEIPGDVRDSSAASILAGGLANLAELELDPESAAYWYSRSESIMRSLWENYSSRNSPEPSILIHGTRSKPHGFMDHGLIYGDYYFFETLLHLKTFSKRTGV